MGFLCQSFYQCFYLIKVILERDRSYQHDCFLDWTPFPFGAHHFDDLFAVVKALGSHDDRRLGHLVGHGEKPCSGMCVCVCSSCVCVCVCVKNLVSFHSSSRWGLGNPQNRKKRGQCAARTC